MIWYQDLVKSVPMIWTSVLIGSCPSTLLLWSGALRTLTMMVVVPATGATVGAIVGGATVAVGRGVSEGARVGVENSLPSGVSSDGETLSEHAASSDRQASAASNLRGDVVMADS
jgi:hypothetical protein